MAGLEFYTAKTKLELMLIQDRDNQNKYVPLLALTPALESASKGKPQAGERRFDYDKRIIVRLEPDDMAILIDVLTLFTRSPKLLTNILQQVKNNPNVYEYRAFRTVGNTQKTMTITYDSSKNTLFLTLNQNEIRVSFPMHMMAPALREAFTVMCHQTLLSRMIESSNTQQNNQSSQAKQQNGQKTEQTTNIEDTGLELQEQATENSDAAIL